MSQHSWSTYQCTDDKQRDECLRCDAKRIRGVNSGWKWHYRRGGSTCTGTIDMSPKERVLMAEGRE